MLITKTPIWDFWIYVTRQPKVSEWARLNVYLTAELKQSCRRLWTVFSHGNQKEWKPATVTRQLTSRTYEVCTPDGRTLRRNRQLLRPSRATVNLHDDDERPIIWQADHINNSEETARNGPSTKASSWNDHHAVNDQSDVAVTDKPISDIPKESHDITRSGRMSRPLNKLILSGP